MINTIDREKLGRPDMDIAGFRLWVHGYANKDSADIIAIDWLTATAHISAKGTDVWLTDLPLEPGYIDLLGLYCYEIVGGNARGASYGYGSDSPHLQFSINKNHRTGKLALNVSSEYGTEHLQIHQVKYDIELSDVGKVMRACSRILDKYPPRNKRE